MNMEGKKISFGFKKMQRSADSRFSVPAPIPAADEKIHYIDCVEENAIKVVGGDVEEKTELVIPVKPNTLSTDRFLQIAAEVEPNLDDTLEKKNDLVKLDKELENETLEQQAARELMEEAKNIQKVETQNVTVPLSTVQQLSGKKEPTLDDYEEIPIADYGMAMLRGMGWTPGQKSKYTAPVMRPRGLGLGADKLVRKDVAKKSTGGKREEDDLKLMIGCCVRIIAGKYAGSYGKVISLSEESARATVELALGNKQVEIGEQLLQPVTRKLYDDRSRVLNLDKYDEYKKIEGLANERPSSSKKSNKSTSRQEDNRNNSKRMVKRDSTSDEGMGNEKSDNHFSNRDYIKGDNSKQNYSRSHSSNGTDKHKSEYKKYSREAVKMSISSEDERANQRSKNVNVSKPHRDSSSIEKDSKKEMRSSHHDFSGEKERIKHKSRREQRARSSSSSEDNRVRRKHKSKTQHKQKDRSSSTDSMCSLSSNDHKKSKKNKKKKSASSVCKREIDKKRKGKKKKRDRDRSPHYRKHKC